MSTQKKNQLKEIMLLAWQIVRKNGFTMGEACSKVKASTLPPPPKAANHKAQKKHVEKLSESEFDNIIKSGGVA
jgi:hypothetical protein|nr:MAG TPA: hypothetical protein [Caudoviricetes sp.]